MPNHLLDQSSPYLQQHVENPVDWYPYTEEAFEKARKEEKLIFLSIGYSACHWCHVMAHESFEDEDIAEYLNHYFISIKIDREERPDVDQIYQTMVQAMGKRGGWPLSVFLTPEGKPFFGGTYFPKESRYGYGMISFPLLLRQLKEKYDDQQSKIDQSGEEVLTALEKINQSTSSSENLTSKGSRHFPFPEEFPHVLELLYDQFDLIEGGLSGAPKFPNFPLLTFLLRQIVELSIENSDLIENIEKVVETTLDGMMHGGIYDHIGGGFHRYSVDNHWTVPHFEKMLYDNAMALGIYAEAFAYFKKDQYKQIVQEIIEWLEREMYENGKGFYSTMDADSEGQEGKYYVWTWEELKTLLTSNEFNLLKNTYDISPKGNFEHKQIILQQTSGLSEIAKTMELDTFELKRQLAHIHTKLFEVRSKRIQPHIDKKIIASWNSLTLHGLYAAIKIFHDDPYEEKIRLLATSVSNFIRTKMMDPISGRLYRVYRNMQAKIPGMLDDYAYFLKALLDEFDISHEEVLLDTAEKVMNYVNTHFWDDEQGLYYFVEDLTEDIPIRPKVLYDNPLPNPNSIMAENLLRFHYYFSNNAGLERADKILKTLLPHALRSPPNFGSFFIASQCMVYGGTDINIIHPEPITGESVNQFRGILNQYYIPRLHVYEGKCCPKNPNRTALEGKPTFYYCQGFNCEQPTTDPQKFKSILDNHHSTINH